MNYPQHAIHGPVKTNKTEIEINGHHYTIFAHPAGLGVAIPIRLMGIAGEQIAVFLSHNIDPLRRWFGKRNQIAAEMRPAYTEELNRLIEELGFDLPKLGASVRDSIWSMADPEKIVREMMMFTLRDGEWMVGEAYDLAFAQNYAELYEVIPTIFAHNRWLDFLSSSVARLAAEKQNQDQPAAERS